MVWYLPPLLLNFFVGSHILLRAMSSETPYPFCFLNCQCIFLPYNSDQTLHVAAMQFTPTEHSDAGPAVTPDVPGSVEV